MTAASVRLASRIASSPAWISTGGVLAVGRVEYFGRTVNVAARIADYARPGEVLVSGEAARVVDPEGVEYRPVGPVALKGVRESVTLATALRAGS